MSWMHRQVPLALMAAVAWCADPTWTIRPVQVISQAEVPEGVPDAAKTVMFNKGFSIGYLIQGDGIIGVDKESLVIDQILLPGGKDITKKRNGKNNWEIGSFPEVSDDGRFCFFQVTSDEHAFGKAESLDIHGSIGVRTASDLKTFSTKAHVLDGGDTEVVDEFSVTFGRDPNDKGETAFFRNDKKDKATVVVSGMLDKLTEVVLMIAGKAIKSEESYGPSTSAGSGVGSRTYIFSRGEGAVPGVLQFKFWKDLKEVVVHFPQK